MIVLFRSLVFSNAESSTAGFLDTQEVAEIFCVSFLLFDLKEFDVVWDDYCAKDTSAGVFEVGFQVFFESDASLVVGVEAFDVDGSLF